MRATYVKTDSDRAVDTAFGVVPLSGRADGAIIGGYFAYLDLEVENVGGDTSSDSDSEAGAGEGGVLNGFKIQTKAHPSGDWHDLVSGADFLDADNKLVEHCTSTGPHQLTVGAKAHFIVNVGNPYAIRIQAKATDDTYVAVRGRATKN